jgi:hypothetical protein
MFFLLSVVCTITDLSDYVLLIYTDGPPFFPLPELSLTDPADKLIRRGALPIWLLGSG